MRGALEVVMTNGEGGIKHHRFQNFSEHKITAIPTKGHPYTVDIIIRTCKAMLNKRIIARQQQAELSYVY